MIRLIMDKFDSKLSYKFNKMCLVSQNNGLMVKVAWLFWLFQNCNNCWQLSSSINATTRNWLEKFGCTIFFIPAYCPDFVSVEFWFCIFNWELTELLNK